MCRIVLDALEQRECDMIKVFWIFKCIFISDLGGSNFRSVAFQKLSDWTGFKDWVGSDKMEVAIVPLTLKVCLESRKLNRREARWAGLVESSENLFQDIWVIIFTIYLCFYHYINVLVFLQTTCNPWNNQGTERWMNKKKE